MTENDGPSLEELGRDECWRLMATQQVGRLGVNAEHYPLIFPVNYRIVGSGVIVIRSGAGTKLTAAGHANVTFEVDEIDAHRQSGWSVLVRGLAEEVTDRHSPELVEQTMSSGVQPWAPGEHEHWVRIIPHTVTGRRIAQGPLLPAFEPTGYL